MMSFKRSSKPPARPPPPRGGLSLGGMSFKKLEDEEEEEDLTISDKYASLLQQSRTSSLSSAPTNVTLPAKSGSFTSAASAPTESKTDPLSSDAEDTDKSSPLRKGNKAAFEYKEILTGLKGKIQEKINKTIEDLSGGESSASVTPDKEHPLLGCLNETAEVAPNQVFNHDEASTKGTALRRRASSPSHAVRPNSMPRPPTVRSVSEERPAPVVSEDRKPEQSSAPLIADEAQEDEENILVFEEHFKEEPIEDFTGGLTTSTVAHSRSKLKSLKKKHPKTVAMVSMSGLMKPANPTEENKRKEGETPSKKPEALRKDSAVASPHRGTSFMRLVSQDVQSVPWPKLVVFTSCVFAYLIIPLPSYMSGLIAGCVLTSLAWMAYNWLLQPAPPKQMPKLTPIEDLPPMEIPEMKEPVLEDGTYKGWMNEITSYNPNDYHINHTYSVFVTLEGSKLRLQRPKTPVPKRAMHDENISTAHFIHQRHFELKGSRVFLQPPGLVKKRIWSKKYPICVALSETGTKIKNVGESSVDGPSIDGPKSDMGFELISEEKCDSSVLYLFARTGREKEEWFRRFVAATQGKPLPNAVLEMRRAIDRQRQLHHRRANSEGSTRQRHNSTDSQSSTTSDPESAAVEAETTDPTLDFTRYMGHLMPAGAFTRLLSPSKTDKEVSASSRLPFTGSIICDSQLYWLNALIGRCFYDFLRDGWWAEKVKDKLQRKLSKIHVPYFIEELQVTAIDMGKEMPVVRRAANPYLDERGFWVELDVSYGGGFQMTIETKMNLMKLKRSNPKQMSTGSGPSSERSPVTDSDEEDSAESSTDEEEDMAAANPEEKESGGGSKKLLKYLNKLTSSKYFQQATEYKYIKRAMENVSNTPLQLQVSVRNLVGKLAVNIPTPPSDRLWYGFRGPPRLWLVAKPQVGERVVTITHITDWIERKLEQEFQRVFVMPNMDDLVIPILRPSQDMGPTDDIDTRHSSSSPL
ncbi:testis-expressed protein 2-like [Babylonia areolata]|uniref:testis-expressed protein 2-like n=1 Tax=Babylonia areolata TaxID=304850 RepID=UPI003FD313BE